jgi:hypothetical protein
MTDAPDGLSEMKVFQTHLFLFFDVPSVILIVY